MSKKEDKQRIYNSQEWNRLRIQKLEQQPLCERCEEHGRVKLAQCVHHKIPIESATNYADMRRLAFCSLSGLQSLCFQCHSDIHKAMRSRTKQGHKQASEAALERWKARHEPKPKKS